LIVWQLFRGSFQQLVLRQFQVNYFFRHLKANYDYLQQLLHLKLAKHFSRLGHLAADAGSLQQLVHMTAAEGSLQLLSSMSI
jgi:hypothetical protein